MSANELKDLGNKAFAAKDYDKAIDLFTQAIAVDPKNHVLFSNRSAAHAGWCSVILANSFLQFCLNIGKKEWADALTDAEQVRCSLVWSRHVYSPHP
jgi:stress-induced-phosphoprotein 1